MQLYHRMPPRSEIPPNKQGLANQIRGTGFHFGSPGEHQLDLLPSHVDGTLPRFEYHPFCHIDFKEQAYVRKQLAEKKAARIPGCGSEFFTNFGFVRASSDNYKQPNNALDCVVTSYDSY